MPIPYRFNPMGKSNRPQAFELVVKPGILASSMTYGFTPSWNSGGYCSVDWGDGSREDAVKSGTALNHTYVTAGTYAIRIKAVCYKVQFGGWGSYPIVDSCSGDWDKLGDLTSGNLMFSMCGNLTASISNLPDGITDGYYMFYHCSNVALSLYRLPESLTHGTGMFEGCSKAQFYFKEFPAGFTGGTGMFSGTRCNFRFTELPDSITNGSSMFSGTITSSFTITKLPAGLINGSGMFYNTGATINLDTLAANAPAEGWTALTNITNMFCYSPNVTGSRSAFLAKCPADVTGASGAFTGTNTTE